MLSVRPRGSRLGSRITIALLGALLGACQGESGSLPQTAPSPPPQTTSPPACMADSSSANPHCPPAGQRSGLQSDPNYDQAVSSVDLWAMQHPASWSFSISTTDPALRFARPIWQRPCGPETNNLTEAAFDNGETAIVVFFDCSIAGATTLDQIRAAYRFVSLDKLPHQIQVPDWTFHIDTPVSSFRDGVTFVSWSGGQLTLSIETPLYDVWGKSTLASCTAPADGPLPACCVVFSQICTTLSLSLSAPFAPSTFAERRSAL